MIQFFKKKIEFDLQNSLLRYLFKNLSYSKFLHLLFFDVLPWLCSCRLEMTKDSYLEICFFTAVLESFSI